MDRKVAEDKAEKVMFIISHRLGDSWTDEDTYELLVDQITCFIMTQFEVNPNA